MKHVTEVFLKYVKFCGKVEITFRPGRGTALSKAAFTTVNTDHIRSCYEEV